MKPFQFEANVFQVGRKTFNIVDDEKVEVILDFFGLSLVVAFDPVFVSEACQTDEVGVLLGIHATDPLS